ncbi:MAG: 30S ribosome-binding factor RbfA [Terriglobales bacterium]
MPHRAERLAEMIREGLTELIGGELGDARIGLAQVTEVKLPPDLRVAQVYVAVVGDAEQQRQSLEALLAARGYLRAELARRLQIRQVPELRFDLDRQEELDRRLGKLLRRAARRAKRGEPPAPE